MVGLIEDVRRVIQPGFKHEGDVIALLGETSDDLSISEYGLSSKGQSTDSMIAQGRVPRLNLTTNWPFSSRAWRPRSLVCFIQRTIARMVDSA